MNKKLFITILLAAVFVSAYYLSCSNFNKKIAGNRVASNLENNERNDKAADDSLTQNNFIAPKKQEQLEILQSALMSNETLDGSELKETTKYLINENKEKAQLFNVLKVVDGDTIDVDINGKTERVRMIGLNTPETVDPRKTVECFGKEASAKAKELLANQQVKLRADASQTDQDKYGRLLRYIWRDDGLFFNLEMIKQGYGYEYTYDLPYAYQAEFKEAQKYAEQNKLGLWADNVCADFSAADKPESLNSPDAPAPNPQCLIKGNINSKGEKIYHLQNCGSYVKTAIDENAGEKWFCSEKEATQAGWRKAKNCL